MTHTLKIKEEYYEHLFEGTKTAEIRFNDREYQCGDRILFMSVDGDEAYEGCWVIRHVHSGLGMLVGYVVLSIVREKEEREGGNNE